MAVNSPMVQDLLHRIRSEQTASGETCELVSFQDFWDTKYAAKDTDFSEPAFLSDVQLLLANNQLAYYQPLTSYHEGASGLVKPAKRAIRKGVAFLFLPLVAAQNNINLAIARLFIHVRCYVNRDKSERDRLALHARELETRLDVQRQQIEALDAQVKALTERLDAQQKGDA